MLLQFKDAVYKIRYTIDEMQAMTGLGNKVSMQDFAIIEDKVQITHGKKKALKEPIRIGIVVFDMRLNLRRLPPYNSRDDAKTKVYIAVHNGHAYSFKNWEQARNIMRTSLSYFEACLKAAAWPETLENAYEKSWELFRETQHMQPDRDAIEAYVMNKLNLEKDAVELVPATATANVYKAWHELPGQNGNLVEWMKTTGHEIYIAENPGRASYPGTWRRAISGVCKHRAFLASHSDFLKVKGIGKAIQGVVKEAPWDTFKPSKASAPVTLIPAKGLELRCNRLNIFQSDGRKIQEQWESIVGMGLTVPEVAYDMTRSLAMDLETCSVVGSNGRFLVYAIGFRYMDRKVQLIAQTVEDLRGGLMWRAVQEWQKVAEEINAGKEGKDRKPLYVYAHNGSKFDAIEAMHSILANDGEVPTDQLESNGKFISFAWRDLVFRDSCLITMSSLASACTAFGLETSKGFLPHRYLQNCRDEDEILSRLHGSVTWAALEPYMDWFSEANDEELHSRKAGRTWEQWRDEQPVRKFWVEHRNDEINFCDTMSAYLDKDVDALWELCDKLGGKFADEFGADIRGKCTLGSIAEHIWSHTLLKPIPKLATEAQHDLWQHANRGGFCGALGTFDFTAPAGQQIYKVDITSLYPASSGAIKFVTEAGSQEPLQEWYAGFPDPTNGWFRYDFGGAMMTDEHYEMLKNMHGIVRIEFDQRDLKFPFFLKKMRHKSFETLAPVMEGGEHYTVPHVRMAYHYGVKISLFECEYAKETREVYGEYMAYFMEKKNGADAVLKVLKRKPKVEWTQADRDESVKAAYERTVAKLFLNGLLGRNNMKLDRAQTLITRCPNDIVCLRADGQAFRSVQIQDIQCGDQFAYRARFKEGTYEYHVKNFNVAPYLSAYMLGYSKMLMQASFQFLSNAGATLLYTDTDSIAFAASPEAWTAYAGLFVPVQKTFGGMELEGEYRRFVTVGPKKYCCVKDDGSYEWACNGMPAKSNTQTDVLRKFEAVLEGQVVDIDYFSINATFDFKLMHTTGASKKLRFLSLKGAVEDNGIRWWKNEHEFVEYAAGVTPVGWEKHTRREMRKALKQEATEIEEEPPSEGTAGSSIRERPPVAEVRIENVEVKEWRKGKRKRPTEGGKAKHYVYILTDVGGKGHSYVGYTPHLEKRLDEHNAGTGADATRGEQWRYFAVLTGFSDRRTALRFESLMHLHRVTDVREWLDVAHAMVEKYAEEFGGVSVM